MCLLVRHTTSLVVAVLAAVADGDVAAHPSGRLLLILLGLWSVYRLATRSQLWQFTAADFCWIVAVGCSVGMIAGGAAAFETHNAAETIVGVALATFVIEIRPGLATPMTVVIVSAYGWGQRRSSGGTTSAGWPTSTTWSPDGWRRPSSA